MHPTRRRIRISIRSATRVLIFLFGAFFLLQAVAFYMHHAYMEKHHLNFFFHEPLNQEGQENKGRQSVRRPVKQSVKLPVEQPVKDSVEQPLERSTSSQDTLDVISIIKRATRKDKLDEDTLSRLPSPSEVRALYGHKPVIYGLETCPEYQKMVQEKSRFIGPAGIFNTGTNLLYILLNQNCFIRRGGGILWQVPWGKHTPPTWRNRNFPNKKVNHFDALPAVTIKDPLTWMKSMCRRSYSANWRHYEKHCPDFNIPKGKNAQYLQARVRYNSFNITQHNSLLHLWNDYYGQWVNTTYPRLIVRYEDLLFRAEETVKQICECGGGKLKDQEFRYVEGSAKGTSGPHKGATGLADALQKYGNFTWRQGILTDEVDLDYARRELRKDMVEVFNYLMP